MNNEDEAIHPWIANNPEAQGCVRSLAAAEDCTERQAFAGWCLWHGYMSRVDEAYMAMAREALDVPFFRHAVLKRHPEFAEDRTP